MRVPEQGQTAAEAPARTVEVRAPDGIVLRGRWWQRQLTRGVLIVAHGFSEHGGLYGPLAAAVGTALELDVIAVDFRGHGASPGRRGVVRAYDDLVGDLRTVVDWVGAQKLDGPRFLFGHSNGGQVALRLLLQKSSEVAGVIVSNPALRVSLPIPAIKRWIGRVLLRFAPGVTLRAETRPELLTRDPLMQHEHLTDPLRHNHMSAPLFFGMIEGGNMLVARAGELCTPILTVVGAQDAVIDPAATREFHDRLSSDDKTLLIYPKMVHEPLNDLGREQVIDDIVRWLGARL